MAEEEKIREHAKHALQDLTDKSKNWKNRIKDFLWEVFIILVAVNITLWFHNWNDKKHEERDIALYLNTLKIELKKNAENFDSYAKWLQKSVKYADYLKSNNKKNLNKDSLNYYAITSPGDGCGYMNINSLSTQFFSTNAFEMFKISNFMSKITDKELLMSIWRAYSMLEYTKGLIDKSFQIKENEAMKEQELIADGKPIAVPMRIYYSTDLPYSLITWCEVASETINETISKLEESKMLKQ